MRITVELDAADLASVQRATGIRKHSPAVRQAIASYVKDLKRKRFLRRVMGGKSDYTLNNEELEGRDTHVSLYSCDPHFTLVRDKGNIPLRLL